MPKVIKTLAIATIVAGPASAAFAQSPPPWPYYPAAPGSYYYSDVGTDFPVAPYGYATPSYSSHFGTYPAYTYDPDPWLRAQLRSDFNRGVDTPGR
jgi:hypothetical protein